MTPANRTPAYRTPAYRKPRSAGGFTLVEVLFAVSLSAVIMGLMVWINVNTTTNAQRTVIVTQMQSQARVGLAGMIQNIHASDQVLATYGSYTTDTITGIVLEAPSYTSSGGVIAGQYDHIVYHLVGTGAPYTLNRLVTVGSGSARAASADTAIAQNVQSLSFQYASTQTISSGNGTTTQFTLNAPAAGSGAAWIQSAMQGGASLPIVTSAPGAGQAEFLAPSTSPAFPKGSVAFGTPPPTKSVTDLVYSVDPSLSASAAQISQVSVDMTVTASDISLGPTGSKTVEMTSSTTLHNH